MFKTTEVFIRVPNFRNFGQRLGELQRGASEADEADDAAQPDEAAVTPESKQEQIREAEAEFRKLVGNMTGAEAEGMKAAAAAMGGSLEQMFKRIAGAANDAVENAPPSMPAENEFHYDLEQLRIELPKGMKWDSASEKAVDDFLRDWPKTRAALLQETFNIYEAIYPDVAEFYDGDPGRDSSCRNHPHRNPLRIFSAFRTST